MPGCQRHGAGVLGQRDVLPGFPKTGNVRAALCGGDVVVCQPVENADWPVRHVHPINDVPVAGRVERNVAGEREAARRAVHRVEPFERSVVSRFTVAGETHDSDPCWVDPGMLAEHLECAVGVADVSQATELVLVVLRAGDAAAGEAINNEGRDPERGEFARPIVLEA